MNFFENNQEQNIVERKNELLNPNPETKYIMLQTMFEYFAKDDIWNAIIVAGEMTLAGIEIKTELNYEQIEKMKDELEQLRDKLKNDSDPGNYIDLARCIYHFQNIGLDFPKLSDEEIKKLQSLPDTFRTDSEWPKTHLAYIPQIASALNQGIDSLKKPSDAGIVREQLEQDIISKQGGEKQLDSMIIGAGLLAQFDNEEVKNLLQSDAWKNGLKWTELLDYFQKLKQEKNGWHLARLLPPMQTLIKLYRIENSN